MSAERDRTALAYGPDLRREEDYLPDLEESQLDADEIRQQAIDSLRDSLQGAANSIERTAVAFGKSVHSGTREESEAASRALIAARTNFRELNESIWRGVGALLHEANAPVVHRTGGSDG